jgi:hypothetical protein
VQLDPSDSNGGPSNGQIFSETEVVGLYAGLGYVGK